MNEQLPYFYETEVQWTTARKGVMRAPNLPTLEVAAPPEFKGPDGIWTPEHLFVGSVNLCFMTTFLAIAGLSKLEFADFNCHARGKLEKVEGKGFQMTEIVLHPKLVLRNSHDVERAQRILEKTETNCLISNSINTVVKLEPEISVAKVTEGASA